jgi:hypothetical protein
MVVTGNTKFQETLEQKTPNNNLILVYYIGVLDPRTGQIVAQFEEYIKTIVERIVIKRENCDAIFIPTLTYDTRIECINPKYITDYELITKHRLLMEELHENLMFQINKLKEENGK